MAKWSWGDWKPEDYEGFNKDLNGVPDKLVAKYDPKKYEQRKDIWYRVRQAAGIEPMEKISEEKPGASIVNWLHELPSKIKGAGQAYFSGIGESLPGHKFVEKIVPEATKKEIEMARAENPLTTKVGKIGGTVGQFVAPGAGIIKGATIPAMAANAALNMAPYAAGEGLDVYSETGDVGKAAKKALVSEALGVGLGTALGGLGLLFGKLAKKAHPVLNEIDAASYGLIARDIQKPAGEYAKKMGLSPVGYKAKQGENNLDKIMTLLREQGGRSKEGIEKAAQWINNQYDSVNQIFSKSGLKIVDKTQDILKAPIVQTMRNKFGQNEVDSTIQTLIAEVDKRIQSGPKGWTDARKFLNSQMQRGIEIGRKAEGKSLSEVTKNADLGELIQDSASVVKAHMNELTGNILKQIPGSPNLESLDQIYGAYPSLQQTLARRMGKPMASMAGGSETTAGLGTLAGIAGMLGGPAAAGVAKMAGATALAPLLKRGLGSATNQIMGRSAEAIDTLLKNLAKMKSSNIPGLTARTIGIARQTIPGEMTEEKPGLPSQGTLESPAQESAKVSETAIPPENKEAAKEQVNTAWADEIRDRLNGLYDAYLSPYSDEMSREDFIAEIAKVTNNFDPHMTAGAIFPDKQQREAYLRSYDTALKLQGVNMEQALTRAPLGVNPTKNPLLGAVVGADTETQMAADRLKDIVVQHVTETGKPPSQTVIRQISTDIDGIAGLRVSPATKRRVLQEHLANYGIDYAQLARYGLVQGLTA